MASIEKRIYASGVIGWRARVDLKGFPEFTRTFKTKADAKKWAAEKEAELSRKRDFNPCESEFRTMAELIDRYLSDYAPQLKTENKRRQQLAWWRKHLGKYQIRLVTPAVIHDMKRKLMNEETVLKVCPSGVVLKRGKRSHSTCNRYLASMSHCFTIGVTEFQWVDENPVQKVTRLEESRPRDRCLDTGEIDRLLTACKKVRSPHLFDFVLFALATGGRSSEILGLEWKNISFAEGFATFRDTKNGSDRKIALSATVLTMLQKKKMRRVDASPFVFPSKMGTKPACIKQAWKNALQLANISNVRPHDLRHTAATALANQGGSLLEIQAVLGHRSATMSKLYTHMSARSTALLVERTNNDLLGKHVLDVFGT